MAKPHDHFTPELAQRYDERNAKLSDISDCLHFLTHLVLKELPETASILSIGAGTGAEILALAKSHPKWTFTASEPSQAMLDVCRQRLSQAGVAGRCTFINGYAYDLPREPKYDAALSMLVAHFVSREERPKFYNEIVSRLKPGGYLVSAEISYDLDSAEFPAMLKNWEQIQSLMGATAESLAALPKALKEVLTVLPAAETETLLKQAGVAVPVRFFQAFMISAWYGSV